MCGDFGGGEVVEGVECFVYFVGVVYLWLCFVVYGVDGGRVECVEVGGVVVGVLVVGGLGVVFF